jgi:hypothetical protein
MLKSFHFILFNFNSEDQKFYDVKIILFCTLQLGYRVAQLVEALRYKPEGRVFDSRWSHWNYLVT